LNVSARPRAAPNELAVVAPDWLQALAPPVWYERYGRRAENYRLPKAEKERLELAATIGADGDQLLASVDAAVEHPWLAQLPAIHVLREVWTAQYINCVCLPLASHLRESPARNSQAALSHLQGKFIQATIPLK
jgi:hypothetical protein